MIFEQSLCNFWKSTKAFSYHSCYIIAMGAQSKLMVRFDQRSAHVIVFFSRTAAPLLIQTHRVLINFSSYGFLFNRNGYETVKRTTYIIRLLCELVQFF